MTELQIRNEAENAEFWRRKKRKALKSTTENAPQVMELTGLR
jgi:hypothetical protein